MPLVRLLPALLMLGCGSRAGPAAGPSAGPSAAPSSTVQPATAALGTFDLAATRDDGGPGLRLTLDLALHPAPNRGDGIDVQEVRGTWTSDAEIHGLRSGTVLGLMPPTGQIHVSLDPMPDDAGPGFSGTARGDSLVGRWFEGTVAGPQPVGTFVAVRR